MEYQIICVGKVKEEFFRKKLLDMKSKFPRNTLTIVEVEDEKTKENLSEAELQKILKTEADRILEQLDTEKKSLIVALCIEGKQYTDAEWQEKLEKEIRDNEYERITYIIGGSLGLHESVTRRAKLKLSFSRMTFPHQLMRVTLVDHILRAYL